MDSSKMETFDVVVVTGHDWEPSDNEGGSGRS
jgi:hypothetical protein